MPHVLTVTGPIAPEQLGVTYAHEHLFGGPPEWSADYADSDLTMLSVDAAMKELGLFRQAGGQSIIDMSPIGYQRRPAELRRVSDETGICIVMATGMHKEAYSGRLTANATIEELAAQFVADVDEGVGEGRVRAGVIKGATSLNKIEAGEEKVLRAAARAHLETGAPISTHTQNGTMGLEQIEILRQEGVDPSRVALGHVDRKLEYDYHRAMLETGAYLIYDQISKEKYVHDSDRVAMLIRLANEGFGGQLMVAGDFGRQSYWTSNGGGPGLTYILWRFVPWLISEGLSREAVDALLVDNPARFFAF